MTRPCLRVTLHASSAHAGYTRDVNADLGNHVSAAASVASDVPIAASRVNYQGTDGAVSPGSPSPSTLWYFANGNTSHGYSEYLAIQNPNPGPVQVRVQLLPTHRRAFTVVRTMAATSRITLKLNHFVTDAVGVIVRSNGPVVVNRPTKDSSRHRQQEWSDHTAHHVVLRGRTAGPIGP